MITQISYNVLIERFRAFASAHFLIKGFSHGDLSNIDIEKGVQFPWMHVLPVEVEPRAGSRLYSFVIIFADLPRDKETPAEYQRECISDCIKLAEDLLAEVQNGLTVFGPTVELDGSANIEVFINEFSHTLAGVNLQLTLSVPWDWSACDIPADFTIGGSGSGGTGGGGGGGGTVTSVGLSAPSAFTVSGSPVTTSGTLTLTGAGDATEYIDGAGDLQTFPVLAPVATSGDYNDLSNLPFIPENLKDLQDVSATLPTNGQVLTFNAISGEWEPASNGSGTVTSVGLSMPNAFAVTGSPVTGSGTLTVQALGTTTQYISGDGELVNFPTIPSVSGFVPYTGATQDVDLDANKLSAQSIYIEGTNGNGHLHLKHQNADATATGQSTALWADTNGDIKWKNDGDYKTTLKSSLNTADRVYTFPNESAELMPRNAAITSGTATKITYDADGLVTAGASIVSTDISDSTTIGQNLLTLANPSAVRYVRINADNTVSAISLATLKSELGLLRGVQTSNLTNSSTAANTNITGCILALEANSSYIGRLIVSSGFVSTAGFFLLFTFPSGSTMNVGQISSTTVSGQFMQWQAVTSGTALTNRLNQANNQIGLTTIEIFISTGANSGNLTPAFITPSNGLTATVYGNATFIQLEKI